MAGILSFFKYNHTRDERAATHVPSAPSRSDGKRRPDMKSNEPSRLALMVARQRAAHQLLDHGTILDDPYAVRILVL
jgi:hypothetical protein